MAKTLPLILLVLLMTTGCTTGEKMSRLREGMAKEKVISILGRPDGFETRGEYETLSYYHRLVTGWAWDRGDYHVIFKENKVTAYGVGEIRVKENNVLIIMPLR